MDTYLGEKTLHTKRWCFIIIVTMLKMSNCIERINAKQKHINKYVSAIFPLVWVAFLYNQLGLGGGGGGDGGT